MGVMSEEECSPLLSPSSPLVPPLSPSLPPLSTHERRARRRDVSVLILTISILALPALLFALISLDLLPSGSSPFLSDFIPSRPPSLEDYFALRLTGERGVSGGVDWTSHSNASLFVDVDVVEARSRHVHSREDNEWNVEEDEPFHVFSRPDISYTIKNISLLEQHHPLDSAVHYLALVGYYDDGGIVRYGLCTFERACTSREHIHLIVHDLEQWHYFSLLLPSCHEKLVRKSFVICRCFHEYYQATVMPYQYEVEQQVHEKATERALQRLSAQIEGWGEEDARSMLNKRTLFSPFLDEMRSARFVRSKHEQANVQSEQTEEQTSQQDSWSNSWNDWLGKWWQPGPSLYVEPFTDHPPSSMMVAADKAAFDPVTHMPLVRILRMREHWWSINKWVDHQHIAHWAQKLMVMQASYGHWLNACSRRFYRSSDSSNETSYVEPTDRISRRLLRCRQSDPTPGIPPLSCFEPLHGILFHDTAAPITHHMANILNITSLALNRWVNSAENDRIKTRRDCKARDSSRHSITLSPQSLWDSISTLVSSSITLAPEVDAAGHPPFTSLHVKPDAPMLWWQDLYQRWPDEILNNRQKQKSYLPYYRNVTTLHCIDRVSFSPIYGKLTESAYDSVYWREASLNWFGLKLPKHHVSRELTHMKPIVPYSTHRSESLSSVITSALTWLSCPPPRAVLITRPDRAILNRGEIKTLLLNEFNLHIDILTINEKTSSKEQANIFASSGLILASHSSQLINVMFSPPGSAIIEITGEFYNLDFARYATSMGVYFRYAFGGEFQGGKEVEEKIEKCSALIAHCEGDNFCIKDIEWWGCTQSRHFPNKNKPFYANLTAVKQAVRRSLEHISSLCYGRWNHIVLQHLTP